MTEGNYGTYQPEYGRRGGATFAFTAKDDKGHLYEIKQGVVKDGVIGKDAILH